jgi:hypothetical protein
MILGGERPSYQVAYRIGPDGVHQAWLVELPDISLTVTSRAGLGPAMRARVARFLDVPEDSFDLTFEPVRERSRGRLRASLGDRRLGWMVGLVMIGMLVLAEAGVGALVLSQTGFLLPRRPAMTCSVREIYRCRDTADSIASWPGTALTPPLSDRVTAIDIRSAPAEWADSMDPGFRAADWAALLGFDDGKSVLAACHYRSESKVTCRTEERPFVPRSGPPGSARRHRPQG